MSYNPNKNQAIWYIAFVEMFLNLVIIGLAFYFSFAQISGGFSWDKIIFWYGIIAVISGGYLWYHSIQLIRGKLLNDWKYQLSAYVSTAIIGGLILTIEYFVVKYK